MRVIENTRQAANLAVIGLGTTGRDDTALHNQTQLRLPLEQWLWPVGGVPGGRCLRFCSPCPQFGQPEISSTIEKQHGASAITKTY